MTTHPVNGADAPDAVKQYLYQVFSKELEGEHMDCAIASARAELWADGHRWSDIPARRAIHVREYLAYFFNSTTIIGVVHHELLENVPKTLEEAIGSRSPEEAIGGCYYM